MEIRPARKDDLPVILDLIIELAEYEKAPDQVIATVKDLEDALFTEDPKVFCHLVEVEEEIVGMALWFLNFSTWQGKHGIYLEDLFIRPAFRGQGFGKALLQYLAEICVREGYPRFQWWVLDWNDPAIEFYKSLGAQAMDEWTVYRLSEVALSDLGKASG
jgi:GNAT superfamily N-acetyltransferase